MSRVSRHYPLWDDCNTSMEILHARIEKYFTQKHPEFKNRFYTDFYKGADLLWKTDDQIEVITFGDTVRKIFQSGNYISKELRFWNIGHTFKMLQDLLLFDGDDIVNLVPRSLLFSRKEGDPIDFNKPIDLVYAGRISRQKNIENLIYFHQALIEMGLDIKLHLFGSYDNRFHEHRGRQKWGDYKQELESLVSDYKVKPIFHGRVGQEEWLEFEFEQPIAISLSTFFGEDFGVSLAQAGEKGWPIICSDFGGHKDISGSQISKIPSWLCEGVFCSSRVKKEMAKQAAHVFMENKFSIVKEVIVQNRLATITLEEVDQKRRKLLEAVGSSALWINLESLGSFADTQDGGLFIRKCLNFLETQSEKEIVLLVSQDDDDFIIEKMVEFGKNHKVHIVREDEISYKDNLFLLKSVDKAFSSPKVSKKNRDIISQLFS